MPRNILFIVLMGILATGLLILLVNDDGGVTFGMPNDEFGRLVSLSALALLFASALARPGRLGQALRGALLWALIIAALMIGYIFRHDLGLVASRLQAGLMPGTAVVTRQTEDGLSEVVIQKSIGGHFQVRADIEGEPVDLLVDTGASSVALTYDDAERLGLDPASLSYALQVQTANGIASAALVTLGSIEIGPIRRENVRATVSAEDTLHQSLLGMNVLGDLTSFEMRRDALILRD